MVESKRPHINKVSGHDDDDDDKDNQIFIVNIELEDLANRKLCLARTAKKLLNFNN